jgi:hypothetical protein
MATKLITRYVYNKFNGRPLKVYYGYNYKQVLSKIYADFGEDLNEVYHSSEKKF